MSNWKAQDLPTALFNMDNSAKNVTRNSYKLDRLAKQTNSSADKQLRETVREVVDNLCVFTRWTEIAVQFLNYQVAELEKMSNAQGRHALRNLNVKDVGREVYRNMTRN